MAEKRKLLSEIDKCFKKIDEGVEEFETIMGKMQDANSDNQRDKYQDDLKREIKKLQRLRDLLKGWQNNPDIKDKDKLTQYRRLIEQRMEQFKDIERENKTKPHSKVGLCAEEKVDPKEREKLETTEWLQSMITDLEVEVDRTETNIESHAQADSATKKGRKGKDDAKKNDSNKKFEDLKKHHERMKFHIQRLELCMRLVNNETLESRHVLDTLKDPVEMYIASLDPDYDNENGPSEALDPEESYEELDLGSYATTLGGVVHVSSIDHDADKASELDSGFHHENGHGLEEEQTKSRHGSAEAAPLSPATLIKKSSLTMIHKSVSRQLSTDSSNTPLLASTPSTRLASPPTVLPTVVPPPPGIPYNSIVTSGLRATPPTAEIKTPPVTSIKATTITQAQTTQSKPPSQQRTMSFTALTSTTATTTPVSIETRSSPTNNENNSPPDPTPNAGLPTNSQTYSSKNNEATLSVDGAACFSLSECAEVTSSQRLCSQMDTSLATTVDLSVRSISHINQDVSKNLTKQLPSVDIGSSIAISTTEVLHSPIEGGSMPAMKGSGISFGNTNDSSLMNQQLPTAEDTYRHILRTSQTMNNSKQYESPLKAIIPPWLGASPLGRVAPSAELEAQLLALDQVLMRCPPYLESERPRCYLPKLNCPTPPYYPSTTLSYVDTLEYYLRLSPESLFFAFYYMEGSRAQLLAAKALKRLSWRFHTKYLMWFQRHEEPKEITDDFERGTYVYFDYEKWAQRKKDSFVFEYRYLEDKDFD